MRNGGRYLIVHNLRTPDGRGNGIVAECVNGEWVICRVGSLAGENFPRDAAVYDGGGGVLIPSMVDLCGFPDRYQSALSLKQETALAARCGYGTVADYSFSDEGQTPEGAQTRRSHAQCRILTIAPLPKKPEDIAECADRGAAALSDGGKPISDPALLLAYMAEAAKKDLPLILFPFCPGWSGALRDDKTAAYFRVPGVPDVAEELAVKRLLTLAGATGCRIHIPCVSTAGALREIRRAKADGIPVTCGVTPFHFALTSADVFLNGTAAKLQPPLRGRDSVEAVREAIADHTVDCISSGHVPCRRWEKQRSMLDAPAGASGYQTALGACIRHLVQAGVIDLPHLIRLMSEAPAEIVGCKCALAPGEPANFAVLAPETEWVVGDCAPGEEEMVTPFRGQTLCGRVAHSFVMGKWY